MEELLKQLKESRLIIEEMRKDLPQIVANIKEISDNTVTLSDLTIKALQINLLL